MGLASLRFLLHQIVSGLFPFPLLLLLQQPKILHSLNHLSHEELAKEVAVHLLLDRNVLLKLFAYTSQRPLLCLVDLGVSLVSLLLFVLLISFPNLFFGVLDLGVQPPLSGLFDLVLHHTMVVDDLFGQIGLQAVQLMLVHLTDGLADVILIHARVQQLGRVGQEFHFLDRQPVALHIFCQLEIALQEHRVFDLELVEDLHETNLVEIGRADLRAVGSDCTRPLLLKPPLQKRVPLKLLVVENC